MKDRSEWFWVGDTSEKPTPAFASAAFVALAKKNKDANAVGLSKRVLLGMGLLLRE